MKAALLYQKEASEGITYKSNCSLLSVPAVQQVVDEESSDEEIVEVLIVFLDLETSSLHRNCEILQIA